MPMRFVGPRDSDGIPTAYLEGVGARDLSDEDMTRLDPELRHSVYASGLWAEEAAASDERVAAQPAAGGLVNTDHPYMVGENGPETVVPDPSLAQPEPPTTTEPA